MAYYNLPQAVLQVPAPSLMDTDGDEILGWKRPRRGEVWVPERPHEEVQSPQGEHPLSTVMWETE